MKTNHLPWKLRNTDFFQPGWHTEPTAAYQLMIEFLRLSPSYELARLSRLGKLSNDQIKKLPRDFKNVLAVYDLIGDINYMLFREWWLINGLRVFGVPFTKQDVHEIAFIDSNNDFYFTNLNLKIESKIREIRKLEGTRPTVLLTVPLDLKKSDVFKRINLILKLHSQNTTKKQIQPKISLVGKRFHPSTNYRGLRLLWFKAAKPNLVNWRLGASFDINSNYKNVLDPKAPRKTKNNLESEDRINLGKITERQIKKFERIAENAARGRFPSDEAVEVLDFEYPILAKRLQKYLDWVKDHC
jgi:hypothetical protein